MARARVILCLLLPAVFLLAGCGDSAPASSHASPDPGDLTVGEPGAAFDPQLALPRGAALDLRHDDTAFTAYLQRVMDRAHFPGMAIAIVKDGRLAWVKALGYADLENRIPVTTDTLFMVGSLSKTAIATAVMQLWQDGRLELVDAVDKYLPFPVRHPDRPDVPITIRELVTHTSSIADDFDRLDAMTTAGDCPIPLGDFLAGYLVPGGAYYDADKNFYHWAPGAHWKYSNVAASLAAYLVEEITGVSFDEYCRAEIFDPLAMPRSDFRLAGLDLDQVALPYVSLETGGYYNFGHYGLPYYPAGTLRTSIREIARLLLLYTRHGEVDGVRLLEPATLAWLERPQFPNRWPHQAVFWYYGKYDDREVLGHQGGGWGIAAKMFFRPEDGTGVIFLANGNWKGLAARLIIEGMMTSLFRAADRLGDLGPAPRPDLTHHVPEFVPMAN